MHTTLGIAAAIISSLVSLALAIGCWIYWRDRRELEELLADLEARNQEATPLRRQRAHRRAESEQDSQRLRSIR